MLFDASLELNDKVKSLLDMINSKGRKFVCNYTGGGSLFQQIFMTHPGASQSAIMFNMPYATDAIDMLLGGRPEKYCCAETARHLALVAYRQSLRFGGEIGLGATCSLRTKQDKRGPHQFFVAAQTALETRCFSVTLEKGYRTRLQEEEVVAEEILRQLSAAYDIHPATYIDDSLLPSESERLDLENRVSAPGDLGLASDLLARRIPTNYKKLPDGPLLIYPGAFNPPHAGHLGAMKVAQSMFPDANAFFEVCINNVGGKRPLDYFDMVERIRNFKSKGQLIFTDLPLFIDKAKYFGPRTIFVVGIDTLERLADPTFCGNRTDLRGPDLKQWMIEQYLTCNCRFLVFGRVDKNGKFKTITNYSDEQIPAEIKGLCIPVAEADFRFDISSTQLRTQAK